MLIECLMHNREHLVGIEIAFTGGALAHFLVEF